MHREEELEIDLQEIFLYLLYRCWIIIFAMVLCAGIAFGNAKKSYTPLYQSSALMYVNASTDIGGMNISVASVGRGGLLIETYDTILKTRDTLQEIADYTGCGYSYGQLGGMISTSAVGETDVMKVVVVSSDPVMAKEIADAVTKILPAKIAEIIDGTSVRVVETAMVPTAPFTSGYSSGTSKGAIFGFLISTGILVLRVLLKKKITSVDYLKDTYDDIPLLAVIPVIDTK